MHSLAEEQYKGGEHAYNLLTVSMSMSMSMNMSIYSSVIRQGARRELLIVSISKSTRMSIYRTVRRRGARRDFTNAAILR
jgi:hypothetical protein